MGRIVAISSGDLESTKAIHAYAVGMLRGTSKNVLFIGTASHDAAGYIENITAAFSQLGCTVRPLRLTARVYSRGEIQEMVSWADLIYVGGGDTVFMMNTWRNHGLDTMLRAVYDHDGAVLMGISAGAICWFRCGCSDSPLADLRPGAAYGWANGMLNLFDYAYCPHYEDRVEDFELLLREKRINGLAMESNTAFVAENGRIHYVKSREAAKAYAYRYENGGFRKEEIELMLVE